MRKGSRALILLLIIVTLAGCRQSAASTTQSAPLVLSLMVEPENPAVGMASLQITVLDPAGHPVNDATVAIRGDMTHAGMQPVLATAVPLGNGIYRAGFEWTMAGDWIVAVTATLPDGRSATQEFDFTVAP